MLLGNSHGQTECLAISPLSVLAVQSHQVAMFPKKVDLTAAYQGHKVCS